MIIDLHSHTYYSACGRDDPEALVKEMIKQGVAVLGITDHNYGVADRREQYRAEVLSLKEKYKGEIDILCGVEMCTLPCQEYRDAPGAEFDYCLVEHLDLPDSLMEGDLVQYTRGYGCAVGIAHTDLFTFAKDRGLDPFEYIKSLADAGVFWELNVNYDSIHGYREHAYVKRFFEDEEQQSIVKRAGLYLSVGFDGHRMEDYVVERVKAANDFILRGGFNHALDLIRNRKNCRLQTK